MRYGSVCSGIEAASVAWKPLDWEPVFLAEIAKFPSRVLAHHHPSTPNVGDFTSLVHDQSPVPAIDLLVGGTPCQSFSVAGLRGGLADDRGNLALEFFRLAQRTRPRWVVWENVPGVLSSDGGRDFGAILGALAELGYGFAYRVLDAQFFGVPQRRRRVFVVGCAGGWAAAAAVLFERASLRGDSAPSRATREDVAGSLGGGSGGRGWCDDLDRRGAFVPETVHTLRGEGFDASEDGTGRGTPLIAKALTTSQQRLDSETETFIVDEAQITSPGNRCAPRPGPSHTLNSTNAGRALAFHHTQDPISDEVSMPPQSGLDGMGLKTPRALVRRLTPLECERLQGFPDGYTAIPGAADGPRYAALGNSMAVPVMRWIGERIAAVDLALRVTTKGAP